jgi:hypothetical protein
VTFAFCKEDKNEKVKETLKTTEASKQISTKKLRTKKEKRAKQFIHSHPTKLDSIDEKIDDVIKPTAKTPTASIEKPQPQKKQSRQRLRSAIRRNNDEQIKHFDEEEHPVKKLIGVESTKKKNKKKFQIIGQEVKIKPKHSTTPPIANAPPIATTIPSTPVTTTNPPPTVTTSPPVVEIPKKTSPPPPSPKPVVVSTTTSAPLRSISEIIQEEAATLLSTKPSFSEETAEEIVEANENIQATTTAPVDLNDNTKSGEEDADSTESDSESSSSDTDSNSNEETEEKDASFDPPAINKMKQFYENAKESVHGVFDLKDEKDSS